MHRPYPARLQLLGEIGRVRQLGRPVRQWYPWYLGPLAILLEQLPSPGCWSASDPQIRRTKIQPAEDTGIEVGVGVAQNADIGTPDPHSGNRIHATAAKHAHAGSSVGKHNIVDDDAQLV
jgi:hypothetical protein